MTNTWRALGALAAIALVVAACGNDDDLDSADTVVEIAMVDIAFEPDSVTVPAGEEITFRFTNDGAIIHEATIGTAEEQQAHAQEMAAGTDHGDMDHGDGDNLSLTLGKGESAELTHVFAAPGEYLIGCHEPGHYEAGMVMTVTVR